ncbi:hypothetical protein [Moraxella marmotae]|uniref:hypothetical protein n=1 Tax=Moraxella marmotae TaxID=3344520 RepID=UPI003671B49C
MLMLCKKLKDKCVKTHTRRAIWATYGIMGHLPSVHYSIFDGTLGWTTDNDE